MVANQSSLGTVATAGGIVPIGAAPAAVAASDSKKIVVNMCLQCACVCVCVCVCVHVYVHTCVCVWHMYPLIVVNAVA